MATEATSIKKTKKTVKPKEGVLAGLRYFLQDLGGRLQLVLLPADQRLRLRARWGGHVPALAAALAEAMDEAPELFDWAPATADQLREGAGRARVLGEIQTALGQFALRIGDSLLVAKSDLFDTTGTIVQGVQMMIDSPATKPAVRERLLQVCSQALGIVSERKDEIVGKRLESVSARADSDARFAELQAQIEERDAELRALRGEPAPLAARTATRKPAAGKPRKTRR